MSKAPVLTGTGAGTGEEVAALLGLASPPCFTQLSVTMCGQMAAASRAPVTSGSLRFWANTKKLLNTVQRLADEHQLHVEVTLRADGSADGLLLSFGGLSAELEQQVPHAAPVVLQKSRCQLHLPRLLWRVLLCICR